MLVDLDVAGDSVSFSIRLKFVNAIKTGINRGATKFRKSILRASKGLFDVEFDMQNIEQKAERAYRAVREEFNALFNDVALYMETREIQQFFMVPNTSPAKFGEDTWEPLAESTLRRKEKSSKSPVQKFWSAGEFRKGLHAMRTRGMPGEIDLVVGIFNTDPVKTLSNELGAVGRGERVQHGRPILSPLYDAIYNGVKHNLIERIRKASKEYDRRGGTSHRDMVSLIKAYRQNGEYKEWFNKI